MVELLHRERTIKVKIVYYGPPVGGKTTNLQVLHRHAQAARRGEMISINSAQDRTILFDLLPLRSGGFRGFDLRLQVLAVPGQAMYAATRRLVLKGADSIVFVANSAADRWEENIQSFREMTQNLLAHQLDPSSIPLVLQFNKRDLPETTPFDFMERALNARKVDVIPAVAVRGEGVLETFSSILLRTVQDLATRYQIVETAKGQNLVQWTQQTVLGMFGSSTLSPEAAAPSDSGSARAISAPGRDQVAPQAPAAPPARISPPVTPTPPAPPAPPPARLTVRVALPEEFARMAASGPDSRANETLVESYAQASQQLSSAMGDLREERDAARQRLEDLQAALGAARDVLAGQPLAPLLKSLLGRMADSARATGASFLVPDAEQGVRAQAVRGLTLEPLLRLPGGARLVAGRFLSDSLPRLHQAADSLDLGEALETEEGPLSAVVSVPVRTPRGLQGLAMLYYAADAPPPRQEDLAHLQTMAEALAAPLELASALEAVRDADRARQLAGTATVATHGVDEIFALLVKLRERLGTMRRRTDAPAWFLEEFAQLAPLLGGALSAARALVAFARGEVEREPVAVDDLVDGLAPAVSLSAAPGAETVSGDPALLRIALRLLIDETRGAGAGADAPPLKVLAVAEAGQVRLDLPEHLAPPQTREGKGEGLAMARRIAELHGGSLSVERDARGATRFRLYLNPA